MTKLTRYSGILITLAAAASVFSTTAFASIIYDNSQNYKGGYFGSANEFGDQISFDAANTDRVITSFKFDYYLNPSASGNETADLRLYANDGPGGAPGSLLYESGSFHIGTGQNGFNTVTADGLSIPAPDTITWTVLFGGVEAFETAGLLFYDPPVVGKSFNDYWEKEAGVWTLKQFNDPSGAMVANFGAVVTAVPEPSTIALSILGGLMFVSTALKRRFAAK